MLNADLISWLDYVFDVIKLLWNTKPEYWYIPLNMSNVGGNLEMVQKKWSLALKSLPVELGKFQYCHVSLKVIFQLFRGHGLTKLTLEYWWVAGKFFKQQRTKNNTRNTLKVYLRSEGFDPSVLNPGNTTHVEQQIKNWRRETSNITNKL